MSAGQATAVDAAILERFKRFLDVAGEAPADPRDRDEVRRRALMQLDLESEARHRQVMRVAGHVTEALAWYPDAAEIADWPDPWPPIRALGSGTAEPTTAERARATR